MASQPVSVLGLGAHLGSHFWELGLPRGCETPFHHYRLCVAGRSRRGARVSLGAPGGLPRARALLQPAGRACTAMATRVLT